MTAIRPPLRITAFRRLALAYALGQLGDWLLEIALSVVVFERTRSALATAGLFLAIRFLPALAAPTLVVRIERHGLRGPLAGLAAARTATLGALAICAAGGTVPALVLLGLLDGVFAVMGRALARRAVAVVVPGDEELRAANALLNVVFSVMAAAGPAVAGLLIAGIGAGATVAIAAQMLDAAAVLLALTRIGPAVPLAAAGARAGIRYVTRPPALRRLLVAQAVAIVFFTAVVPVEVVYAKTSLHAGALGYGALLTSWGAGMILGSLAFAAGARVSLRPLLLAGTATVAVAYAISALAPSLAVACAAAVIGGAGNGVQWVAVVCMAQKLAGDALQARVIARLESLALAMPGVGFLIGGLVTATTSPRVTFGVAAAGIAVVLIAGFGRQPIVNFTMFRRFAGNSRFPERSIPRATAR